MTDHPSSAPPFYDLIVIGASAGGIEALSQLVSTLPAQFPAPIVVAQHLDPTRPSHLSEILGRRSVLRIQTVAEGEPQALTPGVVYLAPPDRDVEVTDGAVALQVGAPKHPIPSVDRLLRSAASAYGERLIAVILTGSGSDGAAGAREVKAAGGTVVIEDPETASYPSMPASLAPSNVDLVVTLERMGALLGDLVSGIYASLQVEDEGLLAALLAQVYEQSGIDFALYKQSTIVRRLQRRMAAVGIRTLREYLRYIQQRPEEYARLVLSFLIKVTEFFRDPEVFTALREQVLPDLIADARTRGQELRIWSAGCATGEEPYSLAIALCETLGDELAQFSVRIFATDVDEQAIAFARRGIYPPSALLGIPSGLKERYFLATEGGFAVAPKLRSLVIFGDHDLGQRAPFPDMDLVLCRNVLIYFTTELQIRALQLFAYALRDGGYLVLGQAEAITPLADLFAPMEGKLKIFRRHGERILVPPRRPRSLMPLAPLSQAWLGAQPERQPEPRALTLVPSRAQGRSVVGPPLDAPEAWPRLGTSRERLGTLLLSLSTGVVVIDRQYDVHIINSAACQLLGVYRPAVGNDLLHLVERVPIELLRSALDAAFRPLLETSQSVQLLPQTVALPTTEGASRATIQITVYPAAAPLSSPAVGGAAGDTTASAAQSPPAVEAVLLLVSTGPLLSSVASPTTITPGSGEAQQSPSAAQRRSAESRQAARIRELEAANRELTDANLELRQANEEMLLRQEEVQAADEEVRTVNEELQATNEELETLNEELEATAEELRATNDDLAAQSRELQQMVEQRELQRVASETTRARLAAILTQMTEPVLVVDAGGQLFLINAAYGTLFGESGTTTPPVALYDLEGRPLRADATPQARVRENAPFRMEFTLTDADGNQRWYVAHGQPVLDQEGGQLGGIVTLHEITESTLRTIREHFLEHAISELHTPLMALLVLLNSLQRVLDQRPAEVEHGGLHAVAALALQQAGYLRALVDDLADPLREANTAFEVHRESMELVALLQQTIDIFELGRKADEEGVSTRLQFHVEVMPVPGTPLWIFADPVRVKQIVMNLLTYALTTAPEGAHILLRVRKAQDWAQVEVTPDSNGAPRDAALHPITLLRQAIVPDITNLEGLGLGLRIVAHLVEAQDGTIEISQEPGQGAAFVVRFPLPSAVDADPESVQQRVPKPDA